MSQRIPNPSAVQAQVPTGSFVAFDTNGFGSQLLATSDLDGLGTGLLSRNYSYENKAQQPFAKLALSLAPMNVTEAGFIRLESDSEYYQMEVLPGNGARRIEFVGIPAEFLKNFAVGNYLSVPFASSGNRLDALPCQISTPRPQQSEEV